MNNPESDNKFAPKQALAPTPQLYDELVGDSMEKLARASLAHIPSIPAGAVVHDNGCGTGAGSAAVVDAISGAWNGVVIKGTDINKNALDIYRDRATDSSWPAKALEMDSQKLSFKGNTFSYSIGNALLFVLPNNGIDAVKEMFRTLKPGGTMIVNSWAYVPNIEPIQTAARVTRPSGTPLPRQGMQKWSAGKFVTDIVEKAGFDRTMISLTNVDVYCTTPELAHFATLLWSFIGGTSEVGWTKSDEENWDKAIDVIKEEIKKTEGFKSLEGGTAQLKFVANVVTATK